MRKALIDDSKVQYNMESNLSLEQVSEMDQYFEEQNWLDVPEYVEAIFQELISDVDIANIEPETACRIVRAAKEQNLSPIELMVRITNEYLQLVL